MSGTTVAERAASTCATDTHHHDDASRNALPLVVALPVIGGLSAGLWMVLWQVWRAAFGS